MPFSHWKPASKKGEKGPSGDQQFGSHINKKLIKVGRAKKITSPPPSSPSMHMQNPGISPHRYLARSHMCAHTATSRRVLSGKRNQTTQPQPTSFPSNGQWWFFVQLLLIQDGKHTRQAQMDLRCDPTSGCQRRQPAGSWLFLVVIFMTRL